MISVEKIPFEQVPQFSDRDVAYVTNDERLRPFYKYPVTLDAFAEVFKDKTKDQTDRATLVKVLKKQYLPIAASPATLKNIEALEQDNTFTVITAHQPSLFTGPLYYIYKIISTINLARQLNERYPDYHVVPVFITGGEDHDFEEVQKANIFNKTLVWENEESGSVGAMKTDTLQPVLSELKDLLGQSPHAVEIYQLMEEAYSENKIYANATIQMVNSLFGKDGLLVVGMNDADLKRGFIPIMTEELLQQSSCELVEETSNQLNEAGFKTQAAPREINLFYLRDQIRERIVFDEGNYHVLNTDYKFSETELLAEVNQHPEHFSPNVVMRPLYQELTFPNLAYIGGGGELAYWLERKTQFAHFKINYPMLIRRNSVLWLDPSMHKMMDKLDLKVADIFVETESLIKVFLKRISDEPLHLKPEKEQLDKMFNNIAERIKLIDPTLEATVKAEGARQIKSLENMEGRLMRAEKQKHDIAVNQIRAIKDKLFLNNGLQERRDNFLSFYVKYGPEFFETLKRELDPMDKRFVVIVDRADQG